MRAVEAARLLEIDDMDLQSTQAVKAAAAAKIRAAHPDNGGDPALAPSQIAKAKQARDLLVSRIEDGVPIDEEPCPACKGKGSIHVGGFKKQECRRCDGTGTITREQ